MRISVYESSELQGTILALKGMDRTLASEIRKHTRAIGEPEWRSSLAHNSSNLLENRVLVDTGRVAVSNQNVTLKSGGLAKKLSGGAKAFEVSHLVEFGADPAWKMQVTSPTGKDYVRRYGSRFKARNLKGHVVYPAAADIIPRIASLWVQTTVRTFHEAIERGGR